MLYKGVGDDCTVSLCVQSPVASNTYSKAEEGKQTETEAAKPESAASSVWNPFKGKSQVTCCYLHDFLLVGEMLVCFASKMRGFQSIFGSS